MCAKKYLKEKKNLAWCFSSKMVYKKTKPFLINNSNMFHPTNKYLFAVFSLGQVEYSSKRCRAELDL